MLRAVLWIGSALLLLLLATTVTRRAAADAPQTSPSLAGKFPWSAGNNITDFAVMHFDLYNLAKGEVVEKDWWPRQHGGSSDGSGGPRLVVGRSDALFEEGRILPLGFCFDFGTGQLATPGATGRVTSLALYLREEAERTKKPAPAIGRPGEPGALFFSSDFRRIVLFEDGDIWRAEFDYSTGKVVGKTRVTSAGLYQPTWPELWCDNTLYIVARFTPDKPIVRLNLLSGATEEIADQQIFDQHDSTRLRTRIPFDSNPSGTRVFRSTGPVIHTFDARTARAADIDNAAGFYLPSTRKTGTPPIWVDENTALNVWFGTILKLDCTAGTISPLYKGSTRLVLRKLLPAKTCIQVAAPFDPPYESFLVDLRNGKKTVLPFDTNAASTWVSDDLCVYGKTSGGLSEMGTWTYSRRTGESKRLCQLPYNGGYPAQYLPASDEVLFINNERGGWFRVKRNGEGFASVDLPLRFECNRISPVPVDLGLGTPPTPAWRPVK